MKPIFKAFLYIFIALGLLQIGNFTVEYIEDSLYRFIIIYPFAVIGTRLVYDIYKLERK
jgi:hypothetical protein